jgi:hypothetical protein
MRGQAMQAACAGREVGMLALHPCSEDQARAIVAHVTAQIADDDVCDIANLNSPAQVCNGQAGRWYAVTPHHRLRRLWSAGRRRRWTRCAGRREPTASGGA